MQGCYPYQYFYNILEVCVKILCLQWPLPPPFPTLAQWLDGLMVLTVHCAEKQPAHLPFVPYPHGSVGTSFARWRAAGGAI